jgi:hypothetical protein
MEYKRKITRREFMKTGALVAASTALAACATPTAEAPVVPTEAPPEPTVAPPEAPTEAPVEKPVEVPTATVPPAPTYTDPLRCFFGRTASCHPSTNACLKAQWSSRRWKASAHGGLFAVAGASPSLGTDQMGDRGCGLTMN